MRRWAFKRSAMLGNTDLTERVLVEGPSQLLPGTESAGFPASEEGQGKPGGQTAPGQHVPMPFSLVSFPPFQRADLGRNPASGPERRRCAKSPFCRGPEKWRPPVRYPPTGRVTLEFRPPKGGHRHPSFSSTSPSLQVPGSICTIRPQTRDPDTSVVTLNISIRSLFPPNVHSERGKRIILRVERREVGQVV